MHCDDSPADSSGLWSAKDHLIHLSHWRDYAATLLDAVRTGVTDALPPPEDEDTINANVYATNKDRPAAEIRRDAVASWDRLEAAIAACSEEDLAKPHPRDSSRPVWPAIPGNGHAHLAQHLMFRGLDEGDEQRAEGAQLWCHDVDMATFADPVPRAFSDYNLACFYAIVGRAPEAARLLGKSFAAAPELKKVAARDRDLDGIRDSREVRALLTT